MQDAALTELSPDLTDAIAPEITRHRLTDGVIAHHLRLDKDEVDEAAIDAVLSADDATAAKRLVKAEDGRRLRRARAALRLLLGAYTRREPTNLRIARTPQGKPFLEPGSGDTVSFNMSASGDDMLVAIAPSGHVGADIEPLARIIDSARLSSTVLSDEERTWFEALEPAAQHDAFLRLWTIKEAVLKADGAGLRIRPASIVCPIAFREGAGGARDVVVGEHLYTVSDISGHGCAASAAYRS